MSEIDLKGIVELDKILIEKDREIERLNNKVEELMTLYTTERYVKEDYKAIIKEVRTYIKENILAYEYVDRLKHYHNATTEDIDNILEILDKVEENSK